MVAQSKSQPKKNYGVINDLWGVLLYAATLIILFSLISYYPEDSSFKPHGEQIVRNWIGQGGALIAHVLLTSFGLLAFLFPALFGVLGTQLFLRAKPSYTPGKVVGVILGFLSLAIFLKHARFLESLFPFLPGGLLGYALSDVLTKYLSNLGTFIIAGTSAVTSALLISNWSLREWRLPKKEAEIQDEPAPEESSWRLGDMSKAPEPAIHFKMPTEQARLEPDDDFHIIERDVSEGVRVVEQAEHEPKQKAKEYELPPLKLLDFDAPEHIPIDQGMMRTQAGKLEKTFAQFGIPGHVREIRPGPVVTLFEFVPAPGIKLSKIAALADDIAMAMEAVHVRIVAPIPGKGAVGIELPNDHREMVYLKEIVADPHYRKQPHKLCMAVGKTIEGKPYFVNLADMPHVLIAGTTGSGKSVSVNAMICSILYRATPNEVRFLMIDPKMLELSIYDGIPHLLLPPIIDSKKAAVALKWAVKEMDRRYQVMNEVGVRDIYGYNGKSEEKMPFIVVVVDEYADLVAVAGKDVEGYVMRIAQKARACGIHVMLATQRPSVDIITGVIKANFPVRMGFRLAAAHDSKTIINRSGAEKLLGKGDMLIMPPGTSDVMRIHGAYVSEKELFRVIEFWKAQGTPQYDMNIVVPPPEDIIEGELGADPQSSDERYDEAVQIVMRTQKCSTSWLQRQLGIGYNRAARIVEQMERENIVGPILNAKGDREIFGQN